MYYLYITCHYLYPVAEENKDDIKEDIHAYIKFTYPNGGKSFFASGFPDDKVLKYLTEYCTTNNNKGSCNEFIKYYNKYKSAVRMNILFFPLIMAGSLVLFLSLI